MKAELLYTKDEGPWTGRRWLNAEAHVDPAAGSATATVPAGAAVFYISLIDEKGLIVSSEHVEIERPSK